MTEGIRRSVLIKKIGKQGGQGRDDGDLGGDLQYIKRKRIAIYIIVARMRRRNKEKTDPADFGQSRFFSRFPVFTVPVLFPEEAKR